MTRPLRRTATELPVVSFSDWDNVRTVKSAIRGLEQGVFDRASQLVEAMGRDDRISGCLETRTRALPGLPLTLEPRGDGRQKRAVAKELDDYFDELYPNAALSELHSWGILLGVGVAENLWEYGEKRWLPRLRVWHPRFLTYRQDTRSFWLQTVEGSREVVPGDGQWVLYTPYGLARGWMQGKVRSLHVPWLMRQWGLRDWARYSEVHGLPIKVARTPAGAQEDDMQRFIREVAALGNESIIRAPGGLVEGQQYDLELLEAMSNNWETFNRLLDKAEACIAVALLGQNLTTEVRAGSFAAAQAHLSIRNDVLQFDAETLGQCIRTQSLSWWALHNFGSAELAPMPKWKTKQKTPEERTAKGTALANLGAGIVAMRNAGVQLDVDKVVEEEELPTTGPADDIEPAPVPGAPAEPGEEPDDEDAGRATGASGARASGAGTSRRPVAQASIVRLAAGDEALHPASVEGQSYVDGLAEDGTKQLAAALQRDIAAVLALVEDAPDYATLRQRLIEQYGEMDSERETELLHRGMLVAELAGRYALRRESGLPDESSEED